MTENIKLIWPDWQIEGRPLGRGSFGVVYKAVRREYGMETFAAIKAISIPSNPSEIDSLRSEGMDMDATRTYLQEIVNGFVGEIQLMESLKGVQNIVSIEDYKVVEKTDEIGWDIYIRMELLKPLTTYICDRELTENTLVKLGCDICTALEICSKQNIIHRDIKPGNIFVNFLGDFKLGDFGVARKLENLTSGMSHKGSYGYMAPEVITSRWYDASVDTYSLGIVLYQFLNRNRLPFLDTKKQILSYTEKMDAIDRRIHGEPLPAPCDASPAMAEVILRACAFDPKKRFLSASEMKEALMSISDGTYKMSEMSANETPETFYAKKSINNLDRTISVRRAPSESEKKPLADMSNNTSSKKTTFFKKLLKRNRIMEKDVTGEDLKSEKSETLPFRPVSSKSTMKRRKTSENVARGSKVENQIEDKSNNAKVSLTLDSFFEMIESKQTHMFFQPENIKGLNDSEKDKANRLKNMGYCYYNGVGVKKNINKAIDCYKKAAEMGSVLSMHEIATIYRAKSDQVEDLAMALDYYYLAAKNGDYDAGVEYERIVGHAKGERLQGLLERGHSISKIKPIRERQILERSSLGNKNWRRKRK